MSRITSYEEQGIAAQATPRGVGAIALIRISGISIYSLLEECFVFSSQKKLIDLVSHTISHGYIIQSTGQKIDEVMVIKMSAPKTFTGEDTIEITCHNNQIIIDSILKRLYECGLRPAEPGEFARRAVINGKMMLSQAEAINELLKANNQYAISLSLQQLQGSVISFIQECDEALMIIAAWCQANFEFLDEERDFRDNIIEKINTLIIKIQTCLQSGNTQKKLVGGLRLVLAGDANAGKSSLFNALLGRNRAIVHEMAGTTRDVVEDTLVIKGISVILVDTAGIRQTDNPIEQEGIRRTHQEIDKSDIIFYLIDSTKSKDMIQDEMNFIDELIKKNKQIYVLFSKKDLKSQTNTQENMLNAPSIHISCQDNNDIKILYSYIENVIDNLLKHDSMPFLVNDRYIELLKIALDKLIQIYMNMSHSHNIHYELILPEIHSIQQLLSGMSGKAVSEKSFDYVFKQFCVGK